MFPSCKRSITNKSSSSNSSLLLNRTSKNSDEEYEEVYILFCFYLKKANLRFNIIVNLISQLNARFCYSFGQKL